MLKGRRKDVVDICKTLAAEGFGHGSAKECRFRLGVSERRCYELRKEVARAFGINSATVESIGFHALKLGMTDLSGTGK